MLTITLRQEIIDGNGNQVKEVQCHTASPGMKDTQMYDIRLTKESKWPEVRINRNNILSIVTIDEDDTGKASY